MSDLGKPYETPGPNGPGSLRSDEVERQLGEIDPVYEAKLVRKLDIFIIPVVMLLYLLSFLDRYVYSSNPFYYPQRSISEV
jgi:hypothetical protein